MHPHSIAKAVLQSGIRANISVGPLNFNNGRIDRSFIENFKCEYCDNNRLISPAIEIHSLYAFENQIIRDSADIAKEYKMPIHIHVAETDWEMDFIQNRYNNSDIINVLEKLGIMENKVLAAHCINLSKENYIYLAENYKDTFHISGCISSNPKLGSGIIDINSILDNNLNITLGTDSAASNNNLSILNEMRTFSLIIKGLQKNPSVLPAKKVLQMVTSNAAKAIDINAGKIKEGYLADIALIDFDDINLLPRCNDLNALVYSVTEENVKSVIINGKMVMQNRNLLTFDEETVKSKLQNIHNALYSNI